MVTCHECGVIGHFKSECPELRRQKWRESLLKCEARQGNNNQSLNDTQQLYKRQEVAKAYAKGPKGKKYYLGALPKCNRCLCHHHPGNCPKYCGNCKKVGHLVIDCKNPTFAGNQKPPVTCFNCEEGGHIHFECPKLMNQDSE